jgi:hypothetical protein
MERANRNTTQGKPLAISTGARSASAADLESLGGL